MQPAAVGGTRKSYKFSLMQSRVHSNLSFIVVKVAAVDAGGDDGGRVHEVLELLGSLF